ncbi:MAG TPA: transcriptional regulator [Lachnospiraceae bacterium]|nr:transcriptional regulator [Lachnospiraceae bacterium]
MVSKLKDYREKAGISQEDLAKKANVSRTVISQIENGSRTTVTTNTLSKLSKALNAKVEDIFLI